MSNYALDWAFQQPIKGPAKTVLVVLANRANAAHECWPSIDRIAFESGYCKTAVKKALRQLRQYGYLSVNGRSRTSGGSSSNSYRLSLSSSPQHGGHQTPRVTTGPGEQASGDPAWGTSRPGEGAPHDPKPKEGTYIEPKYEPQVSFGRRYSHVEDI